MAPQTRQRIRQETRKIETESAEAGSRQKFKGAEQMNEAMFTSPAGPAVSKAAEFSSVDIKRLRDKMSTLDGQDVVCLVQLIAMHCNPRDVVVNHPEEAAVTVYIDRFPEPLLRALWAILMASPADGNGVEDNNDDEDDVEDGNNGKTAIKIEKD